MLEANQRHLVSMFKLNSNFSQLIYAGKLKVALKRFTVNTRNPNTIWNNSKCNELRYVVDEQLERIYSILFWI